MGSPPPTRGTLFSDISPNFNPGITPAYAGNTAFFQVVCFPYWDHPRLRGEHTDKTVVGYFNSGSPPPTRGTLVNLGLRTNLAGITPAYAGNTF